MLRLGQSVEMFLDSNLDPNVSQPINFSELSSTLTELVPKNSLSYIVCSNVYSSKGQETYSVF